MKDALQNRHGLSRTMRAETDRNLWSATLEYTRTRLNYLINFIYLLVILPVPFVTLVERLHKFEDNALVGGAV